MNPFGFAIVDKDGGVDIRLYHRMEHAEKELQNADNFFTASAPHRIVELYTKEQLERAVVDERKACEKLCDEAAESYLSMGLRQEAGILDYLSGRIGDRSHGIVEPSSQQQAKGDV